MIETGAGRREAGTAAAPLGLPWREFFALLAILLAALVPLLTADLPALIDLPNHAARVAIRARLGGDPFYDALYRVNPAFVPNAAYDVFHALTAGFLSPVASAHAFALLAVLAPVTGVIALARALDRPLLLPALLAALLAHCYGLTWGFLNYQVGLGVALWAAAWWWRVRQGSVLARLVGPSVATVVLFYCHALPLAVYGLVVVGCELESGRRRPGGERVRRLVVASGQFVLPALLLVSGPTSGELTQAALPDPWSSLRGCAKAFHAGLGFGDYLHAAALLVGVLVLAGSGRLRLAPGTRWATLALAAACLLVPDRTAEASCLQQRLPVATALLAAAAATWQPRRRSAGPSVVAALATLLALRTLLLASAYRERASLLADAARTLAVVPDRSLVFTVNGAAVATDGWAKYRAPLRHAACLRALGAHVFVPQLLVSALHHTLAPANATVADANGLFTRQTPIASAADLTLRVDELRELVARGSARGELPALPGGIWLVALHMPADFAYPLDVVEVVAATPELVVLRALGVAASPPGR